MTLVLPFGVDQISSNSLYSVSGSNQNSTMPCVFDNDSFDRDFESALMRDWTSDISDYDVPAEDSPIKTPSDANILKRKAENETEEPVSKKPRADSVVPPISSDVVSSSSSSSDDLCTSSSPSLSCSSFLSSSLSNTSTSLSSSSSSSSSSSEGQDDDASAEMDDDDYMPRRRPYQMWTSRQRWKDERKKVMKMSVTKLSEIDDPELCLLRSVLINNTIKKLHSDIRSERQAKLRQKQQRMDFFVERFSPVSNGADSSEQFAATDFSHSETTNNEVAKPSSPANTSDFYDDSSCDEIFGINEDFLRVPVPDRRVSSPIPTTNNNRDSRNNDSVESMDTTPVVTTANVTCYNNSNSSLTCDTTNDCSSPFYHRRTTQNNNNHNSNNNNLSAFPSAAPSPPCLKQILASVSSGATTGGSQCATQYRTNRDVGAGSGGESFPPRVPILDEVVYHSLLASLETS